MIKRTLISVALGILLAVPLFVVAKDEASGERMKLKEAEVIKAMPEMGTMVVERNGHIYNIVFAKADPDKFELLSKYGIMVDPMKLREGDNITCRGRRFLHHFVPSKCRVEKGSQRKLRSAKKGIIVADVFAVDPINDLIYAAHSLNKHDISIFEGEKSKRYKNGKRYNTHGDHVYKAYWRLKIEAEYDKSDGIYKDVEEIEILSKHDNPPEYGY
ncbi:MAG: hypothetical protein GF332_02275 [Candidatus Moranbacteria bacterium]|nr:hypothetical protein [Candidatus Moranbacteria bacterium]